jgi:hypothetical protein
MGRERPGEGKEKKDQGSEMNLIAGAENLMVMNGFRVQGSGCREVLSFEF